MVWRSVYLIGLMLGILLIAMVISTPVHASADQILEAKGKQSAPLQTLPQWQRIIEDYAFQRYIGPSQKIRAWDKFTSSLYEEPPLRQLLKVNLWFNGFPYKQDNWVYGKEDHWATPSEFLENGGDCEDFAIIKYITLRQLGFDADSMQIAMVYDVFSGTDHAFLIVRHDGEDFILDSRENLTIASHYTKRYKPHFVFNESDLWTFDSPLIARQARGDNSDEVLPGNR